MVDLKDAVLAVAVMALITFATRAFPFVVFSKHKPGPRFMRIQATLPALVLPILLAYALKDTPWTQVHETVRTLISLVLVIGLQVWKRNPLISIFGGTIFFIVYGMMV